MSNVLKGAPVATKISDEVRAEIEILKRQGITPSLAILRMGERPDDISYERGATKRCDNLGIEVKKVLLPQELAQSELLKEIEILNNDKSIHGVLILRPLPSQIDDVAVRNLLSPQKDIDGITDGSLVSVFTDGDKGFAPCTAQACVEVLEHYGEEIKGKNVTILGRSLVVGKPLAMMLLKKHATVTVCHSRTKDIASIAKKSDILIAAIGKAEMVTKEFLNKDMVVIDVGINVNAEGSLCGDVNFGHAEENCRAVTPVPGGVGAVTTSVLAKHVVEAAKRANTAS